MDDGAVESRGVEVVVRGLTHRYRSPGGTLSILRGVDLFLAPGGYGSLRGSSGAGKTTLLSLIGGLEPPQEGELTIGGTDLHGLRGETDLHGLRGDALAAYRRSTVGFVFQHFGLLAALTALENVELAATLARERPRERRRRARDLLAAVGLQDRARHVPARLAGGERQRVAMARALANRPRLLLADEPTGNLDADSTVLVLDLIETLHREWGFTLLVVTHNRTVAERANQQFLLEDGRVRTLSEVRS